MRAKHPFSDRLRRRKVLFFEIGLIIALSVSLYAFNYQSEVVQVYTPPPTEDNIFDSILPAVKWDEEPKVKETPLPKKPEVQKPIENQFEEVGNSADLPQDEPLKIEPFDIDEPIAAKVFSLEPGPEPKQTDEPLWGASKMPHFPGGNPAMYSFIGKEVIYPQYELETGGQGLVQVAFVIEKDGSISNVEVVKHLSPSFDAEAIRLIKAMPNWIPGENNGKKVRVRFTIPIRFQIN